MFTLHLVLMGLAVFFIGTVILGLWLRKNRTKDSAEKSSRIMHFLFFAGMVAPPIVGLFYLGLTHFDELAGLKSLPWKPLFLVIGIIMAIPGLYFLGITNKLLRALGNGANAFRLTKQIVADDIYKRTRNPMSLGFYLFALALGFASNSTFILLAVSLGLIPAHIFFLKYFEELELELRFGESYLEYKKSVPFLIPNFDSTARFILRHTFTSEINLALPKKEKIMKLEKSIHINCSPEKAFAFTTDFANAPKWMVGFIESKILTEGTTRVGTQYTFVSKFIGQKMEMKSEITAWDPPTRYEYKTIDSPMSMHGGFSFKAEGGGTLVTMQAEGEFSGLFKLAEGMMKSQMDKQMEDTMQALKKALEG